MDIILFFKAVVMGVVEGLTEFLPISSTGHLILAASLLQFTGEKVKVFEIVIQTGAILAVMWEYRQRLLSVVYGLGNDKKARQFVLNLIVAFLPAALFGFLFAKAIKTYLFSPIPVALAFIVGGLIIFWVENRHQKRVTPPRVEHVDQMTIWDAFKVGCMQVFALIPGTSRSGATIIGGMVLGLSRKAATEFSFFLAIPTLLAATIYSLYEDHTLLSVSDVPLFIVGLVTSFISAFLCVRWLLRYISSHDFRIFAWYRIIFGCIVLLTAMMQWVNWSE